MRMTLDELKQKVLKHMRKLKKSHPSGLWETLMEEWDGTVRIVSKSTILADEARKEGNALFLQSNHDSKLHHKILHFYNRSVAFAPIGSELLATAYGNRSALLRHVRKYAQSIIEADKALKITESLPLKVKLLCRKADCCTALGSSENRNYLEKAKFVLTKMDDSDEAKRKISDLIIQTESVINAGKLDEPKENRRKTECLRIIAEAEKRDIWSYVEIENNKRFGRHLVAARDFEPGEVVLVERSYMGRLDEPMRFLYCSHCWNYLWTIVPCDNCAWRLFCSDKCKTEASNEYHDMECSTLVKIKEASILEQYPVIPFLVSAFFKALKEAGSIDQLEKDLKVIDECNEDPKKEFPSKKELKEYQIIYTLPLRKVSPTELDWLVEVSIFTLMGIAKWSTLFNTTYNFDEVGKLMNDDVAVFAGAYIFKIFMSINSRCTTIRFAGPYTDDNAEDKPNLPEDLSERFQLCYSLRSLGFLTTTGCVPNVQNFFTYCNRHVIYAIGPIKKGETLVASIVSFFDGHSKAQRQASYQNSYSRSCDCRACKENWSDILGDERSFKTSIFNNPMIGKELLEEMTKMKKEIKEKSQKLNFPDAKYLSKVKNLVVRVWKHFSMPSVVTVAAVQMVTQLIARLHTPGYRGLEKIDSCKI